MRNVRQGLSSLSSSIPLYLLSASAASLALESRTILGRRITSPLLSFGFGWMLRTFSILPLYHPMYDYLSSRLLPAALPLMVLSAQARQDRRQSKNSSNMLRTLIAFLVCSLASCGGAIAAFFIALYSVTYFPTSSLANIPTALVSKVCGCLVATYIGGSANLAEVAWETGLAKDAQGFLGCLAAADVLLMCFYFAGLMLAAKFSRVGRYGVTGFDNTFAKMETTEEDMTLGMVCCCFFGRS